MTMTKKTPASKHLFSGVYPTGILYADKRLERDGDYLRIAFLPFSTLELEWAPGEPAADLRKIVEADAARIIARRGQEYPVSASGQTVTLGFGGPKRHHAAKKKPSAKACRCLEPWVTIEHPQPCKSCGGTVPEEDDAPSSGTKRYHATKKTAKQLDAEIADILAGPTVGSGAFKPGQRVTCHYRGEHVGKVLALDDPRAWANTLAFPQDKPNRRAVKEHLLKHPTAGVTSIPVLYKFGVQWDRRDALSPA